MRIQLTGVARNGGPLALDVPANERVTLHIPRGAAVTITLTLVDDGGAPVNVATGSLVLTVRRASDFEEAEIQKTVAGTASGFISFSLIADDTEDMSAGRYVYDIWLVAGDGSQQPVVGLSAFFLEPASYRRD